MTAHLLPRSTRRSTRTSTTVGIIIGCFFAVVFLLVGSYYLYLLRRRQKAAKRQTERNQPTKTQLKIRETAREGGRVEIGVEMGVVRDGEEGAVLGDGGRGRLPGYEEVVRGGAGTMERGR